MNPNIVISFVIAGLMMLTIAAYNINLGQTSQEITLTSINQNRVKDIAEIMTYDFDHMGFNPNPNIFDLGNPIDRSSSTQIEFSISGTDVVHWYIKNNDPVTSTTNPHDFYLYRDDGTNISKYPVTSFELTYSDTDGNTIADPSSVPKLVSFRVEVEITVESGEPARTDIATGQYAYARTVWRKLFIPVNVNKPW